MLEVCLVIELTIFSTGANMYDRVLVHILMVIPHLMVHVMVSRPKLNLKLN